MPVRLALILALLGATAPPALADLPARVPLPGFALDRTEVTIGRFKAFAAATGARTEAERSGFSFEYGAGWERRPGWSVLKPYGASGSPEAADDAPAVHVTWSEARAFCAWAGGRLPSRREWEAGAYRETRPAPPEGFATGAIYPYPVGPTPDGMNLSGPGDRWPRHAPAGATKAGVNSLHEMGGNVWEWLADRDGEAALTAGGSWWYGPAQTRSEGMQWKQATFHAVYVGFRCAYDAAG